MIKDLFLSLFWIAVAIGLFWLINIFHNETAQGIDKYGIWILLAAGIVTLIQGVQMLFWAIWPTEKNSLENIPLIKEVE